MATAERRPLGASGVTVSAIGVGTNRWSAGSNDTPVLATWKALADGGIDFIDTAEVYGFGKSERLVGQCVASGSAEALVATKFAPFIARTSARQLVGALDRSLARLGRTSVDLYYVHFPFPFASLTAFADGLAEAVKSGKAKAVGVSNFNADDTKRMAELLGQRGTCLAANEIHYSLLNRAPETNGVLAACKEVGASLVAYFPLASGRLAGRADAHGDPRTQKLLRALSAVAEAHQASVGEVALAWLLARDPCIIPIPGATKAAHAAANARAMSLQLTPEEFAAIDAASPPAPAA
ncbi:MAG TPA: aldo/keto reductase [Caulobacteraceae bacterium]|jgi:aryl-alcohol dehydrogenase-like predicted oxidoreductase